MAPNHPNLKRLLALWELESNEAGQSGLGRLSARDLGYFSVVFKDSFVARGAPAGPFRLSFVGTSLEAHLGRNLINIAVEDCFAKGTSPQIAAFLIEAVQRRRPLHAAIVLSSAVRPDRLDAELLCLPFVELAGSGASDLQGHTTTVFGTLAVTGLEELPPEPVHHQLSIETLSVL